MGDSSFIRRLTTVTINSILCEPMFEISEFRTRVCSRVTNELKESIRNDLENSARNGISKYEKPHEEYPA